MRTTYLDIGKSILNGATADEILTNYPDAYAVLASTARADSRGFTSAEAILVFARLVELVSSSENYRSDEWLANYGDLETFKVIKRLRLHSTYLWGGEEQLSLNMKLGRFLGYGTLVLCLASDTILRGGEIHDSESFVDEVNLMHKRYKFLLRLQKELEANPPIDDIGVAAAVYRLDRTITISDWNGVAVGIKGGIMGWHHGITAVEKFMSHVSKTIAELSIYSDFDKIPPSKI